MTTTKPPAEKAPTSTTPTKPVPTPTPAASGTTAARPAKDGGEPDLLPIVRE